MGEIDFTLEAIYRNLDELTMLYKSGEGTKAKTEHHLDRHKELTGQLEIAMKRKYK